MTSALIVLMAARVQDSPVCWLNSVLGKPVKIVGRVLGEGPISGKCGYFDAVEKQLVMVSERAANYPPQSFKSIRVGYDSVGDEGDRAVIVVIQFTPESSPKNWETALSSLGISTKNVAAKEFPVEGSGSRWTLANFAAPLKDYYVQFVRLEGFKGITFCHKKYLSDSAQAWYLSVVK